MAVENIFGDITGQLTSKIFGSILWFGLAFILIGIVGGLMYYFLIYKKKFNIRIKIISNRAEEKHSILFDKAAILTDRKTKTPYLRLWFMKRDFRVPKYNIIQSADIGDYIEMFRKSEDEFYFLTPSVINRKRIIKGDGKLYAVGDQEQIMVDPDMSFWSVKRKTLNKKMFDTESLMMKLLPYVPIIISGIVIIFILYILLDHLPGILSELKDLVAAMKNLQTAQITTGG